MRSRKRESKGKVEFIWIAPFIVQANSLLQRNCFERTRQNEYCQKTSFKITIQDTNGSVFKEFDVQMNTDLSMENFYYLKNGLTGNFRMTADEPDDDDDENFVLLKQKRNICFGII
jgi:hypothetical protein